MKYRKVVRSKMSCLETHPGFYKWLIKGIFELCLQRLSFFENFEIVAISTDKNTVLMTILIKLTLDNFFIKVKKKSAMAAPPSQKI